MLETKYVGNNCKMLVTGFCHQYSLSFNIGHQHPRDVTKILILSPTSRRHKHDCSSDFYTDCSTGCNIERSNVCSTGFGSGWITVVLQLGAPGYFEISHCEVEFD